MSQHALHRFQTITFLRNAGFCAVASGFIAFLFPEHSFAHDGNGKPHQHETDVNALPPAPGLIFDLNVGEYILFDELVRRLSDRKYVLIGEKHDNPIHHHHQAELISRLSTADQQNRAVVWEMFTRDQQASLDQKWQDIPISDLGPEFNWEERGWPSWHDYAPIAQAARENNLAMVAGNLPDDLLRPIISEGTKALPEDLATKLALPEIPENILARFRVEMKQSHCNALPENMLDGFSLVQFARDASLARAMTDATSSDGKDGTDGAFLIAGAMHVRNTLAVPWHLARFEPGLDQGDIAIVSLIEVDDPSDNPPSPQEYADRFGDRRDVDFMWFTNDIARKDPCVDWAIGQ
jgi:uncharacterized iron-regulated protein